MNQAIEHLGNSAFDLHKAVLLANASAIAYAENRQTIENWTNAQGFNSTNCFDLGNTQGYWTTVENIALLAFRGTSNLGQWIRDAKVAPVTHQWGKVHRGFAEGLSKTVVELEIFSKVAKNANQVWITGHSLGGALAILAASKLRIEGISSNIYTYGQPRAGCADFVQNFSEALPGRLFRFVNQSDIVARLPPGLFYRHSPTVKLIVRPGSLQASGSEAFFSPRLDDHDLAALSDEEYELLLEEINQNPEMLSAELEGFPSFIKDHSMLEYIRLLTEIRDNSI